MFETVGSTAMYDHFPTEFVAQLSERLWPSEDSIDAKDEAPDAENSMEDDLEKAIANEVKSLKRPRKEQKFGALVPA